jgi:hypothetical protein
LRQVASSSIFKYIDAHVGSLWTLGADAPTSSPENSCPRQARQLPIDGIDPIGSQEGAAADAVGQICNVVAGYFKARMGFGDKCGLSMPTAVSATNFRICSQREDFEIRLPSLYERELVLVSLAIRL